MGERWTYTATRAPSGRVLFDYALVPDDAPGGVPWWPSRKACKAARKYLAEHPGRPLPAGMQPAETT